jgi:outer membrane lipoprotein-sorting protein
MKRFTFFVFSAALCAGVVFAQSEAGQSAISIMQAVKDHTQADTKSTRSRMVITARDGSTSERVIDQYSKPLKTADSPDGYARTVIVFQSPATVRGTRFLTMDNASGGSDRWIFLPNVGKVRRIATSESGGNFMGTDFSYDDMSSMSRDLDLDTHTILREETLDGAACYVIQSVPKDSSGFQYSRMVSWIDKTNYRLYKREMYDKRGILAKVMEISGYKDVDGHDTSTQTKLSTIASGTSTTIYIDIIKYNDPIPEGVFTTAYLETGRAR